MKSSLPILLILALIINACETPKEQTSDESPLVPRFLSQVIFKGKIADKNAATYSTALIENLVVPSVEQAIDGTLKVYDPLWAPWERDNFLLLEKDAIDRSFKPIDTMYIENPEPPYDLKMIVGGDVRSELDKVIAVRAYEAWAVDSAFKITKEVSAYTLIGENLDPSTGQVRGLEPKFTVYGDFDNSTKSKIATIRYAQSIDNPDSFDEWFRFNLEYSVREELFGRLIESAKEGSQTYYGQPDETTALDAEGLHKKMTFTDTMFIESPAPPFDLQMTIIEEEMYWSSITGIEFVQDVYVDANLNLHYDVKWWAPRSDVYNRMTGEVVGVETLFWIKNY